MTPDLSPFQEYIGTIRSKATAGHYVVSVKSFLEWLERALGPVALNTLPKNTVSEYAQALLRAGYLPGTVNAHLAGINRYFRWLREKGVELPEFHKAELPKVKRKVKDSLSQDMLAHYFRVANELDEPARTATLLLPCSGLRSNEMVSLPLSGLRRSPYLLKDGTTKETLCMVFAGKGGNERIVPLLDEGTQIVMAYMDGWRRAHLDNSFLFPGRYSGHLSTRALRDAVQKVRSALKMKFTPHTMRRTYLTILYRKGVDVTMLAKIAGHSDVNILIDYYLALDERDIVSAVHSTGGRLAL